ncbi:MAG: acetyl esterase [Motiliproteus sp.]
MIDMGKAYPLSAAMRSFVRTTESCFPDEVIEAGIEAQREAYTAMNRLFDVHRPSGLRCRDTFLGMGASKVAVRRYWPERLIQDQRILFIHGGGWYLGDLDSHDHFAGSLAHDCRSELIAVHYRRAPEFPFPAALDDVFAVYLAMLEETPAGVPPLLAGDSAGANLVAALSLRCRDEGVTPALGQVLIYPALAEPGSLPSHQDFSDAPLLNAAAIEFCWRIYGWQSLASMDSQQRSYLAPLAAESLVGLPPARLFPVAFDPLRDDAYEYARRLKLAGVDADLTLGEGLVHGCLRAMGSAQEADRFYDAIRTACCDLLAGINTPSRVTAD